jgi:hypothetical protein
VLTALVLAAAVSPTAAAQTRQVWALPPVQRSSVPLDVPVDQHGPGRALDTRKLIDVRLHGGRRLQVYAQRWTDGVVCVADSFGVSACFPSFQGVPANLRYITVGRLSVLTGVLRDGTRSADARVAGRWVPMHAAGRGVYLEVAADPTGARYHLTDGSTRTCRLMGPC